MTYSITGLCESKATLRKEAFELNAKKKTFLNSLKASNETLNRLDMYLKGISKSKANDSELGCFGAFCNDEVSESSKGLGRKKQTEIREDSLASRKDDFESSILCLFNDYKDGSSLNL